MVIDGGNTKELGKKNEDSTVFYKLKFVWDNDTTSNVVTEVVFAIVFASLLLCWIFICTNSLTALSLHENFVLCLVFIS